MLEASSLKLTVCSLKVQASSLKLEVWNIKLEASSFEAFGYLSPSTTPTRILSGRTARRWWHFLPLTQAVNDSSTRHQTVIDVTSCVVRINRPNGSNLIEHIRKKNRFDEINLLGQGSQSSYSILSLYGSYMEANTRVCLVAMRRKGGWLSFWVPEFLSSWVSEFLSVWVSAFLDARTLESHCFSIVVEQ